MAPMAEAYPRKMFSVLMSNFDRDPREVTSSNITVEYMHIKPCPDKLLNKAITRHVHVACLYNGSVIACQTPSLTPS